MSEPMTKEERTALRALALIAIEEGIGGDVLIEGKGGHWRPAVKLQAKHMIALLDTLDAMERSCADLLKSEEKHEAEIAAWRKGNPSDDLWRVRMEKAVRLAALQADGVFVIGWAASWVNSLAATGHDVAQREAIVARFKAAIGVR